LLYVQDRQDDLDDIIKDVFKIAKNLGIPYNNDFNGVRQNGVGNYQVNQYQVGLNMLSFNLLINLIYSIR
jgi:hypothetical protein